METKWEKSKHIRKVLKGPFSFTHLHLHARYIKLKKMALQNRGFPLAAVSRDKGLRNLETYVPLCL